MGTGRDLYGLKDGTVACGGQFKSFLAKTTSSFVIAFVIDISQRKKLNRRYQAAKEELAANVLKIERLNDELEEKGGDAHQAAQRNHGAPGSQSG